MTIVVVGVVIALCALLGVLIAWPMLRPGASASGSPGAGSDELRLVEDELYRTLTAIREISFDRDSGHLTAEDFADLDGDERARAIALLRRRDALLGAGTSPDSTVEGDPAP